MEFYEWLNSLCGRLQHLLQVQFRKAYHYDLSLASQAVESSQAMLSARQIDHFRDIAPNLAEVVSGAFVNCNDEGALRDIVMMWFYSTQGHREILSHHNVIGIGFSYDPIEDILYATARLR